jgi:hypothetical protein
MNAKQAIFDELGDLFGATSQKSDAVSNEERGTDDGELFLTEEVEGMEAVNEDESDADSGSTAASQQESGTSTDIEDSGRELTDEERDACIEAATDAITETKMSPEALDWGLNFIQRMYDEKNAKIRARIDSLDWASAKARWEQEDAEEAAREQEERDRYLQST